jgi:hypothetical protein
MRSLGSGEAIEPVRVPRGVSSTNRNVWSAVLSQAKNESDRMVCANVFGLRWSTKLLALMECDARALVLFFSNPALEGFSSLQVSNK